MGVACGVALLEHRAFATARHLAAATPVPIIVSNSTPPVAVADDPDQGSAEGIFDPSAVVFKDSVYMTYSSVPTQSLIRTRLAQREAENGTWHFLTEINAPYNATLPGASCPRGLCEGTVVHEVSSLVLDPTDPDSARRVKVRWVAVALNRLVRLHVLLVVALQVLTHTYLVGGDGAFH